ncbi:MAG: hypothetical protein LUG99_00320 [Lachnospiraceae bacterium]|nr:hypothetical protein [Lachnospiraceae bacterium]
MINPDQYRESIKILRSIREDYSIIMKHYQPGNKMYESAIRDDNALEDGIEAMEKVLHDMGEWY